MVPENVSKDYVWLFNFILGRWKTRCNIRNKTLACSDLSMVIAPKSSINTEISVESDKYIEIDNINMFL